ncbi:DUF262 domain-containing protein [uncultured Acinetobacter sp.]|uniref:DUF262 domain-containing protein n=1 Tax=uncultured Acinetobacter sp. TaxID=165433 RepID=UPI00261F8E79|nr:DUF262 domain-containing protein [uncultured Acinetobacter sp.]
MSNIQNIDISLNEIVKNISKDIYQIPKFQRDFVWTNKDILDLGDSIIRGYPISSLLTMPMNGTLQVGSHSLLKEAKMDDSQELDENETKYFVLDGQQRMTSIAKLFLSGDIKNEYYYDLLAILVEKFPEDKIDNDIGLSNLSAKLVKDQLCRNFGRGADRSDKPVRHNNRFIAGQSVVENKYGSVVSKFLRNLKEATDDNIDKYTDYLNGILGAINGYSVPATVIAGDSELGVVIRVFEKVNSTGKKLTLFDLINAKSFEVEIEAYKGGLSEFLTNKIKEKINQRPELKKGLNSFFKYNEDTENYEKLDRIIRFLEICHLLEQKAIPGMIQSTMLRRNAEFWFDKWNEKSSILFEIIGWIEEEGLTDVAQVTFLEYAIAILLANPKAFINTKFKHEIKKYALYLTVTGTSFSKSNLDIVEKFNDIALQIINEHQFKKYEFSSPVGMPNLLSTNILDITTSKAEFRAILNILYNERPNGKFDRDILGYKINRADSSKFDSHHIYPKAQVPDFNNKSKFNSIANIVLLDSQANREEVKDKSPSEYFQYVKSLSEGEFYCNQNLISIDEALKVSSQEEALIFITNRANKIAEAVNCFFKT